MHGYTEVSTSRPRYDETANVAAPESSPLLDDTARMMGHAIERLDNLRSHLEKYSDATLGARPSVAMAPPSAPKSPPPRAHLLRDLAQTLHERITEAEDVAGYLVRTL